MIPKQEMVGLFGLPTQKGMEQVMVKKMGSATDSLKDHIKKELKMPMLLVSAASIALILYLMSKSFKG